MPSVMPMATPCPTAMNIALAPIRDLSDTDGDGFSDNAEIDAGTDPLDPASQPIATPMLNVGSVSMGFTINDYSPLPGPSNHVGHQSAAAAR